MQKIHSRSSHQQVNLSANFHKQLKFKNRNVQLLK